MPYTYFKGDKEHMLHSMKKYLGTVPEMDKLLLARIAPYLANKKCSVLDAGCGIGQLVSFLHALSPYSSFLGIDQTAHVIDEANELFKSPQISFETADVLSLPERFQKRFDITVSRAVISWLPYYEDFMRALVAVTTKHIFLSSLFYEGDIDFITQVREFKKEAGRTGFSEYRNVYSLPQFERFMSRLGATKVSVTPFDISIDIPRGTKDILGTYTVRLANGKRLQISGAVLMNWKWIRIDL